MQVGRGVRGTLSSRTRHLKTTSGTASPDPNTDVSIHEKWAHACWSLFFCVTSFAGLAFIVVEDNDIRPRIPCFLVFYVIDSGLAHACVACNWDFCSAVHSSYRRRPPSKFGRWRRRHGGQKWRARWGLTRGTVRQAGSGRRLSRPRGLLAQQGAGWSGASCLYGSRGTKVPRPII